MAWVEAVAARPKNTSVVAAITAHAEAMGLPEEEIPRRTTVDTWVRLARVDGILALVDRVRSDAGTCRSIEQLSPRVRARIGPLDELIEDVLVGMRGGAIDVFVALQKQLRRNEVEMSYDTVARHVRNWRRRNEHLVHAGRHGMGAVFDDTRLSIGWGPVRPGRILSFDSTPADEWVRILTFAKRQSTWVKVRPIVTRLLDVGSRAAITYEVTVGTVNADVILSVLRRALVPGENWAGFPTTLVPEKVCIDRGPEHQGVVSDALRTLGLAVPVGKSEPEDHPHIERAHNTLNGNVSLGTVGRTSSSRIGVGSTRDEVRGRKQRLREEYRTERPLMALPTLDEFLERCHRVHTAYNHTPHRGLERDARSEHERAVVAA